MSSHTDAAPSHSDNLRFIDWCYYWRGMRDTSQATTPFEEWQLWIADCYKGAGE